jgi:hypothetical protein
VAEQERRKFTLVCKGDKNVSFIQTACFHLNSADISNLADDFDSFQVQFPQSKSVIETDFYDDIV